MTAFVIQNSASASSGSPYFAAPLMLSGNLTNTSSLDVPASSSSWGSQLGLIISALYLDFTRLSPVAIFTIQTWIAIGLVGLLLLLCIIQVCVRHQSTLAPWFCIQTWSK